MPRIIKLQAINLQLITFREVYLNYFASVFESKFFQEEFTFRDLTTVKTVSIQERWIQLHTTKSELT